MQKQANYLYKDVHFGPTKTRLVTHSDGCQHFQLESGLLPHPNKMTDRLIHWANEKPEATFIARRDNQGIMIGMSYKETLSKSRSIAQSLIDLNFTANETIVILSENSIEHALLALAAMHIGIPYSPISPPYSLVSKDFSKLKHCLELMTPKVVFAQDSEVYSEAIEICKSMFPDAVVIVANGNNGRSFDTMLTTTPTSEVDIAYESVNTNSIAKVLFTSGSTGLPKGVINHHGMMCASLQQITQVLPFMQDSPPVFVDWLPWNHTFGGNQNFGMTLYNGGTLYIDDGKPTSKGMSQTIINLKEFSPTAYFNVPTGFEMLIPYLEKDDKLRETFFKDLQILFYAGASLAQPIWNRLEELAIETIGKRIPIITGLGCTEAGPSAMFANWPGAFSGLLGVPVPGLDVKLVVDGDKIEARYKGPNLTKGYWRNEEATNGAFDEEGYYNSGDAVKFLDKDKPDKGLVFDGRIAEDFKLSTGTWVNVGILKSKVISTGSPIIRDVVIAGLDKAYIGVILFLNIDACQKFISEKSGKELENIIKHPSIINYLDNWLIKFNKTATGSSTRVQKYIVAVEPPSIDLGEITDKGSLNQRAVLKHRAHIVEQLFND
jgi:feruloyl-CoA synthase